MLTCSYHAHGRMCPCLSVFSDYKPKLPLAAVQDADLHDACWRYHSPRAPVWNWEQRGLGWWAVEAHSAGGWKDFICR